MLTKEDVAQMPRAERLERLGRTGHELDAAIADRPEACFAAVRTRRTGRPRRSCATSVTPRSSSCSDSRRWRRPTSRRWCPADPERWAEDRQYIRSDAAEAGRAFRRRREECLAHLRGLSDAQWSRAGLHPTFGRMTVEDVVNLMVWHDANHLDQLHRAMRGEA